MPPAFDFPGAPNPGDVFTDPTSAASFTWNGYAWVGGAANSLGALIVSPTPPTSPADNSLWWESDTGMLFLRYNDGNSSQWVQVNALPNGAGYMPLQGVVDGSNAPAGQIGEVISSVVTTPVSLTNITAANIASISLPAGDWDVTGEIFVLFGTGGGTVVHTGLNTASAAIPAVPSLATSRFTLATAFQASIGMWTPVRMCRTSLTATTIYYLVVQAGFASGTTTAQGSIFARRVR